MLLVLDGAARHISARCRVLSRWNGGWCWCGMGGLQISSRREQLCSGSATTKIVFRWPFIFTRNGLGGICEAVHALVCMCIGNLVWIQWRPGDHSRNCFAYLHAYLACVLAYALNSEFWLEEIFRFNGTWCLVVQWSRIETISADFCWIWPILKTLGCRFVNTRIALAYQG